MDIKVQDNRLVWPVAGGFAAVGVTSGGAVQLQIYRDEPYRHWAPVLAEEPTLLPLAVETAEGSTFACCGAFTLRPGASGGLVVERYGQAIFTAPTGFAGHHNGLTWLRFGVNTGKLYKDLGKTPWPT